MLPNDIMSLPWTSALFFAAGYAAYFVANSGIRAHHQQIDVAFSTAVYGFFALLPFQLLTEWKYDRYTASAAAFIIAVVVAAGWRRWGRNAFEWSMRNSGVSHVNDMPSAWIALFETKNVLGTQLCVTLKDGSRYYCDNLHHFKDAPNGACVLGAAGDVLMYPTHSAEPGKEMQPVDDVFSKGWGYEALWLPHDEIRAIHYRRSTSS